MANYYLPADYHNSQSDGPKIEESTDVGLTKRTQLWRPFPEEIISWNPFPIHTRRQFNDLQETLLCSNEKYQQLVTFFRSYDSRNKQYLLKYWIGGGSIRNITWTGFGSKESAMSFQVFMAIAEAWTFDDADTLRSTITKFLRIAKQQFNYRLNQAICLFEYKAARNLISITTVLPKVYMPCHYF